MKPIRITIEEFRCELERYLIRARSEAVTIVAEGECELVLLSAEEYAHPRRPGDPVAMPVEALSEEELDELEQSEIPEETRALNHLLPPSWPGE